jgi:hypothetical protein
VLAYLACGWKCVGPGVKNEIGKGPEIGCGGKRSGVTEFEGFCHDVMM